MTPADLARAIAYARRLTEGGHTDDGTLLSRALLHVLADRNALHRRAQTAEGLLARCGAVEGQAGGGRGLGRALANHAATLATRERDEERARADGLLSLLTEVDDALAGGTSGTSERAVAVREMLARLGETMNGGDVKSNTVARREG